ncbi:MAG: site-specific DNA-methyltransferase [Dehalococcoidia bacterium]|nr:site-specific DNA-methyltransferase [Dehalococcoidia bacterium]
MPEPLTPARVDLETIQAESQQQALPQQEKVFRVASRVRAKLHNLPDPTNPPLGFVPGKGYDTVFPFIKLPHLAPNLNGDWVQFGSPVLEPNRLFYGDNLQVLRTLPTNSIDLIYIDPPFFSGAEYNVIWGDTNEVRTFSDIWDGGLPTYLVWLNARLWEMRRVLKDTGSVYVHCDWHASHYIKAEMDKIFGYENFGGEVVWKRSVAHSDNETFGNVHDTILMYGKGSKWKWNRVYTAYDQEYIDTYYRYKDPDGRRWLSDNVAAPGGRGPRYDWNGHVRNWRYSPETKDDLERQGRIFYTKNGMPRLKRYLDEMPGMPLQSLWSDKVVQGLNSWHREYIGYPTQKPEALLDRIVRASSNEGDIVADFFCGGGVTPIVAQRLGRRWIACDSSRVAISVTLNRLVEQGEELSGVKSNYGTTGTVQHRLDLPESKAAIPDIRVNYVGVYPMDRFKAVDQVEFERFIVACLAAQLDNSDDPISGWRSAREPLRVGPANPDTAPDAKDVQAFFEAVVKKHLQPNVRTVARYVCWRASPDLAVYKRRLTDYVRRNIQPRGTDLDFDFLLIDSEAFRERIRQKYPDADENEFLLRFTKEPVVGEIAAARSGPRTYAFEARDADSTNAGGYLVNCQWDFDYQRGHFGADSAYVLGRRELKGAEAKAAGHKFEAVLTAEHTFTESGPHTIACRVQDNFGAEAIRTLTLEVS